MIHDYIVIGAGIVGLSTAYNILQLQPDANILVLEKEKDIAQHQTSHNSGWFIQAFIINRVVPKQSIAPGDIVCCWIFCEQYAIPYKITGKVIVATQKGN